MEQQRCCKMVGMSKHGAWTRWEHVEPRKLTWAGVLESGTSVHKFLIQSVYDILPSPANHNTWGLADTLECRLCQRRGTMEHILSCCPKAPVEVVVSLTTQSSFKILGRFHLHSDTKQQVSGHPEAINHLHQSRAEGKPPARLLKRAPHHRL